ncbi:MAG: hypothetical protein WCJ71_05280 [Candidatus Omnitrophota bacterium]
MGSFIYEIFVKGLKKFFADTVSQVREINRKYAVPQIKTTAWTHFALISLGVYLAVLLLLLAYKFITLLK